MKSAHGQAAFDRVDRVDSGGDFQCRKGKPCNGRCIPKGHECAEAGASNGQRLAIGARNTGRSLVKRAAITGGASLVLGGAANAMNRMAVRTARHNISKVANQARQTEAEFNLNKKEGLESGDSSQTAAQMKMQVKAGRAQLKQAIKVIKSQRKSVLTPQGLNHAAAEGVRAVRRGVFRVVKGSLEDRAKQGAAARSAETSEAAARANRPMKSAAPREKALPGSR